MATIRVTCSSSDGEHAPAIKDLANIIERIAPYMVDNVTVHVETDYPDPWQEGI